MTGEWVPLPALCVPSYLHEREDETRHLFQAISLSDECVT